MDVKAGSFSVNPFSELSPISSNTGLIKIEMPAFTSQGCPLTFNSVVTPIIDKRCIRQQPSATLASL